MVQKGLNGWAALGALAVATIFFHIQPDASAVLRGPVVDAFVLPFFGVSDSILNSTDTLAEKGARIALLEEENAALKRAQGIAGSSERARLLTRVLWYDPDPARRAVRIAIPDGAEIAEGEAVVAPGDILVGQVTAVSAKSADVLLIDDPDFTLSVSLGEEIGLGKGTGQGALTIDFVPTEAVFEQGIAVRSAGREGAIPTGIFIGWLAVGQKAPGEPFALLRIVPAVDLEALGIVMVLPTGEPFALP
ncbi:MAG: hypothetical protein A2991_04025 [Candidatus Terrybacteria bacterium RIFCSPLOWO2_01_FULL_58_14]|uniref:Cell shape-determining protein MreC n=2 Tax=Candidatus Terryibacteriota TaxID=1817920 RepID=A0A1G2Q109_9BACT|nr:MAG: hypothetical protein A2682_00715 [Candidatus Terrybacteria bacterium RIFCSPHIGHO2_01_FULL_58_15]OHA53531.1 MAG: hypothetical protein A2991_04025 [Candidatus Terrybacteria bacterium RIFCSPLOWO2_01_FULL_58_14]